MQNDQPQLINQIMQVNFMLFFFYRKIKIEHFFLFFGKVNFYFLSFHLILFKHCILFQTPIQNDQDQDAGFVKTKANEKKDKKAKRAEEKKRAREREAKKAANSANDYIPGMEGSIRPADEAVVTNVPEDIHEEFQQRHYVSMPFIFTR